MPIYKRCPHCGKRIPSGTKCGCFKREWGTPTGTRALYHTAQWQKMTRAINAAYGFKDQWAAADGKTVAAEIVHHIVPAEEDPSKFWVASNLIPVSRASHDEIHVLYRQGGAAKLAAQERLRERVKRPE